MLKSLLRTVFNAIMYGSDRICAVCGESKSVSSGKVCTAGHFICYNCTPGMSDANCPAPNCPGRVP